jgi:hypothetical protein
LVTGILEDGVDFGDGAVMVREEDWGEEIEREFALR